MRSLAAQSTVILVALGLLAGCASKDDAVVDPNVFPKNYKREISFTLQTTLEDPTNIRDAFITDPTLTQVNKDQRYAVCVRFNSRDLNRNYKGSTDRIAYFYGGELNQLVEATPEQCGKAAYKPFPELEKLCQAKSCR